MSKFCILQANKLCNDCGDCNKCDLNSSKKCNNCGKCLQLEGYDMKAINIEEIVEDTDEIAHDHDDNVTKGELIEKFATYNAELKEGDIKVEYIEDIDGLNELLQDEEGTKKLMEEAFPGFFIFDAKNEE
ncbi:hypothetical protein [Clostridium ganghwense]|uniref:Uncharacterized protein n=1 Tax=Clostridium ganghwense TaxID=312089 RepID=A0ABT4CVS3_9CLOT|nr:hypothetical protein [Clostridium ganghwense]MCY6372538.1 hypothetical protein [Clostridium ganghwense]